MNKADLIAKVQEILGADATKACAERALNAVIEAIQFGVKKQKKVQLIGFGTFSVVDRKARTGINPKTKEKIKIKASKAIKFKASSAFKAK
ncbi:HU family DNA-binding protein [Intestinicryptomonas porci]|uniref:HU family DNA-binding protein n=1 Tax=Intestinicryptomonas porci TaxID=2926320 RepID=A0ABU4WIF6_9BACT|nr:HU family DNA-binding protein [Opitutales bacterium]MDX8415796.1 HU family DNA-binding protein [Opitutales bacterium CLA-KB-P66]